MEIVTTRKSTGNTWICAEEKCEGIDTYGKFLVSVCNYLFLYSMNFSGGYEVAWVRGRVGAVA